MSMGNPGSVGKHLLTGNVCYVKVLIQLPVKSVTHTIVSTEDIHQ